MNNAKLKEAIRELLGVINSLYDQQAMQDDSARPIINRIRREALNEEVEESNPI